MASRLETPTIHGPISGRKHSNDSLVEFRGIPYAAPPIDELRWRAPQPPEPWGFVRECKRYSPIAWQLGGENHFLDGVISGLGLGRARTAVLRAVVRWTPARESEDCLTLNLTAPADAESLPVMVWFHGGGHSDGAASLANYRSESIPARGCVLITVNYRLGLFGFLAHRDFAKEQDDSAGSNFGLLDQVAALAWVRDNVAFFGGDPARVTIFGESAGGQAVLNLMSSPAAKGLFQRAIAQSPGDSARWIELDSPRLGFDAAHTAGQEFADAAVGAGDGQLDRLRAMDASDLMQLYRDRPDLGRHFHPAIGAAALPESPYACFSGGRQASVPLICGYNADEGSVFAQYLNPAGPEHDPAAGIGSALMAAHGSQDRVDQIELAYPGLLDLNRESVSAYLRDEMFGSYVEHITRSHMGHGNKAFRYHFEAGPSSPRQSIGAFHGAEIAPIFGTSPPLIDPGVGFDELSLDMGDRWVAFASTGVPDRAGSTAWNNFDEDEQVLIFDRSADGRPSSRNEPWVQTPGIGLHLDRIAHLIGSVPN